MGTTFDDLFHETILDFVKDVNINKSKLFSLSSAHARSMGKVRTRLLNANQLRSSVIVNHDDLNAWYYTDDDPAHFYEYPYFDYLTDNKKEKYLKYDIIDFFLGVIKQYNYDLDTFYSYYPKEMAGLPLFGVNKTTKGEISKEIEINGNTVVVKDIFKDEESTYYCLRSEKAHPLGTSHSLVYNYLLNIYIRQNLLSNISEEELGHPRNVVICTSNELARLLGLERYSVKRKVDSCGQVISDLALNTYAKLDSRGVYATDVIRLISEISTTDLEDGSNGKLYRITFTDNTFVKNYTDMTLLRTCNADILLLEDKSKILVPFFQRERIELYDKNQTDKIYTIMSFKNHIRIAGRSRKTVLDVVLPLLEDYKNKNLFIQDYVVNQTKGNIYIRYIPLTSEERASIQVEMKN